MAKRAMKKRARQPNLLAAEKVTIRRLYHEQNYGCPEIAKMYSRAPSCIYKVLFNQRHSMKKVGRPQALTEADVDRIIEVKNKMVKKANVTSEVTLKKIVRRSRIKASARTVRRRFKDRNLPFRPLREKLKLSEPDKKERLAFAKKHKGKPKCWWAKNIHLFIDNKYFKIFHNGKHRDWAASRSIRGAYRSKGQGLEEEYVKPPKSDLKYNTGMKSACITGGVGRGKVLLWHLNTAESWSGAAAADMYAGPLTSALKESYPTHAKKKKASWTILEDNDPTGYKSKKGEKAKSENRIKVFRIPKRSKEKWLSKN